MRAIQISELGGPEVMQVVDIPTPQPRPGQILVRVEACGLNYSDIMIREGRYLEQPKLPYIMGREFAGIIEAVGEGVTHLSVGQRVVGTGNGGALADYIVAHSMAVFPCPDALSPEIAVAMLVQGLTALHCIDDCGGVKAGETVLIHAAAGGVGTLAVQIAKERGARVIGTASSESKCALIRELGAEAINYQEGDWVAELKALTDGKGADVILESVGGEVFKRSFREALADLGRLVVVGAASGEVVKLANVEILGAGKTIIGYFLPIFFKVKPQRIVESSLELVSMIEAGTLKPIVGKVFSLDETVAAFNYIQNRESVGKVIVRP